MVPVLGDGGVMTIVGSPTKIENTLVIVDEDASVTLTANE
jgi:hypothetical protein